jgi:cell division protein FtsL
MTPEERLAIVETEIRYMREAVSQVAESVGKVAADVEKIEKALTTAAGVKLALVSIGAGIAFVATQLWHYLDFRGLK